MAQIPSLKLPSIRLPQIDLPKVSLPKISLPSIHDIDLTDADFRKLLDSDVAERAKELANNVKEVAFTAIGFGVLVVQKAQVRQREILDALRHSGASDAPSTAATPTAAA